MKGGIFYYPSLLCRPGPALAGQDPNFKSPNQKTHKTTPKKKGKPQMEMNGSIDYEQGKKPDTTKAGIFSSGEPALIFDPPKQRKEEKCTTRPAPNVEQR